MDNQNQQPSVSQPISFPQPVASQSATTTPPSRSNKFLLLIVVFVVLIAVATGSYIFTTKQIQTPPQLVAIVTPTKPPPSSTPDVTANSDSIGANWKMYISNELQASFKYPKDWVVNKAYDEGDLLTIWAPKQFSFTNDIQGTQTYSAFFVRVKKYENVSESIEQWVNNHNENWCGVKNNKLTFENYNNGKVVGKKITGLGFPNYIIATKQEIVLWAFSVGIGVSCAGEIYDENTSIMISNKNIFDQILQTFKFTDQDKQAYVCPKTQSIDCMPIVDESRKDECDPSYLRWVQTYCPGVTITQ